MTKMKVDEHDECSEKTLNLMIHKTLFFWWGQAVSGSCWQWQEARRGQEVAGSGRRFREWQAGSAVQGGGSSDR